MSDKKRVVMGMIETSEGLAAKSVDVSSGRAPDIRIKQCEAEEMKPRELVYSSELKPRELVYSLNMKSPLDGATVELTVRLGRWYRLRKRLGLLLYRIALRVLGAEVKIKHEMTVATAEGEDGVWKAESRG